MNWKKVKLGEICEINMGKTPSRSNPEYWGKGYHWVSIADLSSTKGNSFIQNTKEQITDVAVKESGIKMVPANTLLYSFKLSIGKVAITQQPLFTNEAIVALPIKDHNVLNIKYLYHAIQRVDLTGIGDKAVKGITLNKEKLRLIEIPLPDLATQQHIAQVLDQADALRQQNRQLLGYYDELLQSTFIDLFGDPVKNEKGWEMKKLGDLLAFMTSGSRGWAEYYSTFGSLFLRIQNVGYNKLKMNEIAFVNAPDTAEAKRTKVQSGDILLSITADLGRTAVIPENFGDAYISQHLALLRLKENIDSTFISELLSSEYCQRQFKSANKGGVKAGLNFNDIKSTNILMPPLPLQQHFAKIVEEIEAQKSLVQQSLAESEALFEGLLAEYFG